MTRRHHPLFPSFPQEDQRRHRAGVVAALDRVVDSGSYILGGETAGFEAEFGEFLGVKHVVGVGNGTDAIELMLRALDIGPGSKVVVPAHAPSAVAAGVRRSGAAPVFADIEPDTFTLCPESLEAVLRAHAGQGVRAALAVHLYGHPVDWENLRQTAAAHGVTLLEDVAQAHGAVWQGRMAGTLGVASAFSFYPTKNLAACGDAGAVACDDEHMAEKLRLLRQYGWRERYVSAADGVNTRLDEMQAAVLRVKLPFLPESVARREMLAGIYDRRLGAHEFLKTPVVGQGCAHAWHQYVVRTPRRDALVRHLAGAGIPVGVHYPTPLHLQPAFQTQTFVALPHAEAAAREVVSLPLHPHLDEEAVSLVCDVIESLDLEAGHAAS